MLPFDRLKQRLRPLANALRMARRAARGVPQPGKVDFGDLRATEPLCSAYGSDRGTPVDRVYIERFLAAHAVDLRGRVLEVQSDAYTRRFGGAAVERADVLDIDPANRRATVIGDLTDPKTLEPEAYDAIVLTQVLQLVFDLPAAVANLHRALKPGGVLLCTVCGISSVGRGEREDEQWCWSFSRVSLERLLGARFAPGDLRCEAYGNVLTAVAFLEGLAAAELTEREYDAFDPAYPVVIAARAVKAARTG